MNRTLRTTLIGLACCLPGLWTPVAGSTATSASAWKQAMALSDERRFDEALEVVRAGLVADPDDVDLRWLEAGVTGWSGRHREAVTLFEKLIAEHPAVADTARVELGTQRLWAGDPQGALRDAETALGDDPDDPRAGRLRALALAHADRLTEALDAFDALLERTPGDEELELDRALVLGWTGRNAQAVSAYREILEENPGNRRARIGLAQNENWSGRHRRAAEMFESLLEEDSDPEILKGLAFANYWADRPEEAQDALRRFRTVRPEDREGDDLFALLRFERDPNLSGGFEMSDDSDDQRIRTATLDYRYPLARRAALLAFVRDDEVEDPGGTERTLRLGAGLEKRWDRLKAAARIAYFDGDTAASHGLGQARLEFRPRDRLEYSFGVELAPVVTRQSLALGIRATTTEAGLAWAPRDRVRLSASIGHRDYTDGNQAVAASALARWQPVLRRHSRIGLVFGLDLLRFDRDLNNGYYDPESYVEAGPGVEWSKELLNRVELNVRALTGYQKDRRGDGDSFYKLAAGAAIPLGRSMRLHAEVERNNSSLSSDSGFELSRGAIYLTRAF